MNIPYEERTAGYEEKIASFIVKQKQPYDFKVRYAEIRIHEFIQECNVRDLNTHVSVGGLDSITLYMFIQSLGYKIPGVSVSILEDKSIQKIHKQLDLTIIKPYKQAKLLLKRYVLIFDFCTVKFIENTEYK